MIFESRSDKCVSPVSGTLRTTANTSKSRVRLVMVGIIIILQFSFTLMSKLSVFRLVRFVSFLAQIRKVTECQDFVTLDSV